jgi:hypothetical protein
MSPPKFKIEEDTALKTNYQQSSDRKQPDYLSTPYKVQNLEELAMGLPNLYVDT